MSNCTILGFGKAPPFIQQHVNIRKPCSHKDASTWGALIRNPASSENCLCIHKTQIGKPGAHRNCRSNCFGRQIVGRTECINVGRYCILLSISNQLYTSQSSRELKALYHYANFSWTSIKGISKRFMKGHRGRCIIQKGQNILANTGSETEPAICSENLDFDRPTFFSSMGNEELVASTQTISLTIDGVSRDIDSKRLQTQIKEIDGIFDAQIGPLKEGGIRGEYVTVHLHVEGGAAPVSLIREIQALDSKLLILPYRLHSWLWRGQKINYAVAGCGKPIILVHGFGGNAGHFAQLIPYLLDRYRVYAVDLLGFGGSDKPLDANYGPELWAEMICDFGKEFAQEGAVLVGNSIGSLTALAATAMGGADLFRGLVLLNCAGAMNRKGLNQDDPLIWLLSPIFSAVEYLLQRPRIATFLFNRFRSKDNVRKILEEQAYRNKESVTDQLVDILHYPSTLPGAKDVFVKVFTGDPGPRPEALMKEILVPLLVLWGDSDRWTPVNGPVAKYFMKLATERDNISVYALPDVGHCPHDDRPELAADYILHFLSSLNW